MSRASPSSIGRYRCGPIFGFDALAVTIAIAFVVVRTRSRGDVALSQMA